MTNIYQGKKKVALITGYNGFVAQYLTRRLLLNNYLVFGLIRRKSRVEIKNEDVVVLSAIEDVLARQKSIDVVFHLAAHVPYGKFNEPDMELYRSNIQLTGDLVSAFPNAKFIFASSVAVYGVPLETPLTSDSPFYKTDHYGMSKIAGEAIVRNHSDYSIIRFSSIIGPGMRPVSFIPKMIVSARETKVIKVYGNGSRQQNYLDVRDAAELCIACAKYQGSIITLGVAEKSYRNKEAAELVSKYTGATIKMTGEDNSPSFLFLAEDVNRGLGFRPQFSLDQTIAEMCQ